MYTSFWKTMVVLTPGPQGGTNWQPSSFNPNTNMFYVCAQSGVTGSTGGTTEPEQRQPGKPTPVAIGSTLTTPGGFSDNKGTFTAVDATSGKIVWQKQWPESCYAGSATTKGNVVFIGRNNGDLQAYDARTGKQLWSFQTGAGANNAPTIFQRNGKEYLVFYAGGNALAATPHGDNLWLLGLDGTLGPAAAPGTGQGVGHAGEQTSTTPTAQGNATAGKTVWADNCATCHGTDGHGGNGGPDLTTIASAKNLATVKKQVTNGGGGMPAFSGTLTQTQINDVSAYVVQDITGGS
jgi:mono/diheme cytochrome c family protein